MMNLPRRQNLRKHSALSLGDPKSIMKELKIDFNNFIEGKDEWSVEDKISQKVLRSLLDHILLRSIIIALLLGSCIAISCQTDPNILESYAMFFAIFEQILVTIFLWEMLLKWYYGFWIFWKVFAVFGVIIFSTDVPESFGSLEKAMYSLFICITQDGWVQIYEEFVQRDGAIMYWGALYLFIFIIGASFIFANIMVAAVTSNLEQAILEQEEKRHTVADNSRLLTELKDESDSGQRLDLIHVHECMKQITTAHRQQPMKYSSLENLNLTTYEEFCLVLEAIQRNLQHYKQIRLELNSIVKELRDILFNREQQKQIMHHEKRIMDMTEALLTNDMPTFKKKEMLSNMLIMEKQVRRINNSPTGSSLYSRTSDNPLSSTHVLRHLPDN
ncbi:cation channel sperm-associated protein 4-like isoform X3 [Scyliorhinus canicula]|uniref:cation channel sperm-associated protein 4-like isoform X3 n=1 Tax=Scyliorhinus canicula TaxID=7830 RepID=UPI0018F2EAB1|nr:cation channel sperm-associated protein 4-like isoform X3 [Scyliorhinus canicula]